MEFRTSFKALSVNRLITYDKPVFSMGSCFAELLGKRLADGKVTVFANPFGVIYNPVSALGLLASSLKASTVSPEDVLEVRDLFFHYQMHSSIYADSSNSLLNKIEKIQKGVSASLSACSHVFLTWGTSFVYQSNVTQKIVANCHKQPAALFSKRLLGLEEMMRSFDEFYSLLKANNPSATIVLTVSPVRHIKDGIPENQLSKSLLRVFCHQLAVKYNDVFYFPSYEWMMDDLRDYRFYGEDMIHPSKVAEDYIWSRFQETFFGPETIEKYEKILKIKASLNHRPFHPHSTAHQQFLKKLLTQMETLRNEVSFEEEIGYLKEALGMA